MKSKPKILKVKFYYNTKSLKYEKVHIKLWDRLKRVLSVLASGLVFATIIIYIAYTYFDSPKEKQLKREIEQLNYQYELMTGKLIQMDKVLSDLQDRDDNIYRVVLEAEPIASNIRKAGFGGVDRYKELEGYDNSKLIIETTKKLDQISKQLYIQSKSFDDVIKMVKNKAVLLASIPAIMPISNKNLRHQPSGFGWRTHPIYKTSEFHPGMDFAAPTGTPIYATGDGVIQRADAAAQGYGNHVVINHGYGYETLYGHMSRIACKVGQKIKRGQLIGYVGSTGLSTAPHVHYEVMKNSGKLNPVNFYYNDLSPEQYKTMIELSSKSQPAFD